MPHDVMPVGPGSASGATVVEGEREFSIMRGGPFLDILHTLRLIDRDGHVRWVLLVALVWGPMIVAAMLRGVRGRPIDVVIFDPTVHVRLLLSIPLLMLAERLLEARCRGATRGIREDQAIHRARINTILRRGERLASSVFVEGCLGLVAFVGGQAALWGVSSPSGLLHSIEHEATTSFSTFWYTSVGLPLVQFLVLRWLWRWGVWSYVLARLSRIELVTNALHPDQAAGLKVLSGPIDAFAVFVGANSVVASAVWAMQMREYHVPLETFAARFVGFALFAVLVSCVPLLSFTGQIYRARCRDVERYHAFASEYTREFRRRWLTTRHDAIPRTPHSLLGTPDLQSLNDLIGSFDAAHRTRPIAFGARPIIAVGLAVVLPLLPLAFTTMSPTEVVRHLGRMLQLPLM